MTRCRSNRSLAAIQRIAAAFFVAVPGLAATLSDASAPPGVLVIHPNGSVTRTPGAAASGVAGGAGQPSVRYESVRYDFGLPGIPFEKQWLEDDKIPIGHTRWEQDGIRYTQIVLVTRLGPGDLALAGKAAADAVLLVQLVGENGTNQYAEASASLAVRIGDRPLNLELREGLARVAGTNAPELLAAIDISTSGIVAASGSPLQFGGNMPPGTSGAMTFKIPAAPLTGEDAVNRLQDLEFDREVRRVKRYWEDRIRAGDAPSLPLAFARPAR